ncbi:hypothetical protein NONI108955_22635 [Nocardia ninae]|uniref:Uncharacterized protein n=1 Tax=Nocardia ninae NBRC 108245 TaxID=1210091 RepID=A0A511MD07_9NOCA|nr:hypothetical protein [Nocardia ninae]GEM38532.1 hypothetical protein NN4_30510 [Nocardia ninae NBRC 108245]
MNEKYPGPQHNPDEQSPLEQPNPAPHEAETISAATAEADSDQDWELRWAISDAILTAVYDLAQHPGPPALAATATLARNLVEHVYGVATSDQQQRALAVLITTVNDRIVELADAHDDLTTSDLQSGAEALALQLVRHQLIIGTAEPRELEGGDHE